MYNFRSLSNKFPTIFWSLIFRISFPRLRYFSQMGYLKKIKRLVFTCDRVGVGVVSGAVKSVYDLVKLKIGVVRGVISDGIGIRTFPFLLTALTTPSLTFRLWSSENQIFGVGSRSGRINQSQCTFPRFVVGLVLPLLLPTPKIWFSLDHERNVRDGVVRGIGTLFSRHHKLYASDYDSDSDSSENQP